MKKLISLALSVVFLVGVCRLTAHDPAESQQAQTVKQNQKTNENRSQNKSKGKNKKKSRKAALRQLGPAKIQGEVEAQRVSTVAPQADFPAMAVTKDGAVWVAYIEWNGNDSDRVLLRRKTPNGSWSDSIELPDNCFEHYIPALAARCLLEIYQGCRGSYEAWRLPNKEKRGPTQTDDPGHFARDALKVGNVYGFVSFSDHSSTHSSWAGVWVEQPTRESLFDAMLARRTFGASDEIILRVSAKHGQRQIAVGQHLTAKATEPPIIQIEVEAPDIILRVDVVRDGKYVFTTRPNKRTFKAAFSDMQAKPGKSYYYVRVFQRDPEAPAGDPEIAWASPFFVTYE